MQRTASSVQKTISASKSRVGASFACDFNGFNDFNDFNDFPRALRLSSICNLQSKIYSMLHAPCSMPIQIRNPKLPMHFRRVFPIRARTQ